MADGRPRCGVWTRTADCMRQRRQSSTGSFRSLVDALKQGGRGGTRSGHAQRISGVLVIAETGLALAALVTLGLFVRSLYGLENTPAGFNHRNVTVCLLFLSTNNYTPSEEQE